MTRTIDLNEHKIALEDAVASMQLGDEVIVTRGGTQVALITPVESPPTFPVVAPKQRIPGLNRGLVAYISDDFDAELPDSFWFGEE